MIRRLPSWAHLATLGVFILALGYLAWLGWGLLPGNRQDDRDFNGDRALSWAQAQCDLGPRPVGSEEAVLTGDMIIRQLDDLGWETRIQQFDYADFTLRNIVAMAGDEEGPLLIIATHYDTRLRSDRDPDLNKRNQPSPGANDGASGVGVLLELARSLDRDRLKHRIWLVFLDGEANAGLPGWETGVGAKRLAEAVLPDAFIYLNLVGGEHATYPKLPEATEMMQGQLWTIAKRLSLADVFLDVPGPPVTDAHTIYLEMGVPAVEIIQPDYPYFRTAEDTCEHLEADSLRNVGALLEFYLENARFLDIAPSLK